MAKKVLIIGAGPAGSTLATYLKRYNIESLVFENNKSNLALAKEIENYYGIDKISGRDLYQNGLNKLNSLNIPVIREEIVSIDQIDQFEIKTVNNLYKGDILVLASGLAKNSFKLPSLKRFEGLGISYCATCDSFFYRKKKLGLIGSGSFMEEELEVLERITSDITIFTDGANYQNDKHQVITEKIVDVYGDDSGLKGIETIGGKFDLDGLFIANGSYSTFALAKHMGLNVNDSGEVIVDSNYQTNYKGIYAIGDLIPDIKQIAVASSHGVKLAYHLMKNLKWGRWYLA